MPASRGHDHGDPHRLLAGALFGPGVTLAQPSGRAATASEGADAPQEGGPVRRNHAKLYLGFTSNGGTDSSLGAEFNRRNRGWQNLAVAGFVELVFAEDVEFLLGATLQYYPGNRLVLEAGPGRLHRRPHCLGIRGRDRPPVLRRPHVIMRSPSYRSGFRVSR